MVKCLGCGEERENKNYYLCNKCHILQQKYIEDVKKDVLEGCKHEKRLIYHTKTGFKIKICRSCWARSLQLIH